MEKLARNGVPFKYRVYFYYAPHFFSFLIKQRKTGKNVLFPTGFQVWFSFLPSGPSGKKFRWCTLSDLEQRKCAELSKALLAVLPLATINSFARVSCIRAHNTHDCIDKIRVSLRRISELIWNLAPLQGEEKKMVKWIQKWVKSILLCHGTVPET